MGKQKINVHKISLDRNTLKYVNFLKEEIDYKFMLHEIFIYKIIEDSKYKSLKHFNHLSTKIYFHYDWKELFKSEIQEQIKIIFKTYNQIENNFIINLPNVNHLELNVFPQINTISQQTIDFRNYYKSYKTNTIENFIRNLLISQCDRFNKKNLKILNSLQNTDYNHIVEFQLQTKDINLMHLYKCYLIDEDNFREHLFDDLNFKKNIPDYKNIVKLLSHIIYLFFLKTKLNSNKLNLQDLEFISFEKFSFVEDKYIDEPNKSFNELYSYKWNVRKQKSLSILYKNLIKNEIIYCSKNDFNNIFNNKIINEIKPIKIAFDATELLYFIISLMDSSYIERENNLNHNRLKKCFLKSNGKAFTENISVIKNHIKNDKNPSLEKKIRINKILMID